MPWHTPFTEQDIDLFLNQYRRRISGQSQDIKEDVIGQALLDIYPEMTENWREWLSRSRLFEPLAFITYMYRLASRSVLASAIRLQWCAGVVGRGIS